MADKNISPSEEFGNLSQSDLSALIDLLRSQEEYHRDELIRLKQLRKRAESLIPDDYNHLWQQIDDLLEAYDDDPDRLPTDPV